MAFEVPVFCGVELDRSRAQLRYHFRVLGLPEVVVHDLDRERSLHRLRVSLVNRLTTGGVDDYLLVRMVPADGTASTLEVTVPWERTRSTISTPAYSFLTGAHPWVILPRIGAVLCLPAGAAGDGVALQAALDRWFRVTLEDNPNQEPPDPESWEAHRGDRVERLSIEFWPRWPEPGRAPEGRLGIDGEEPGIGATEILHVASSLGDLYPTGLHLDTEPDPRVPALAHLLYVDRRPSPLALVGPSGAGKTTIVHAAVRRTMHEESERHQNCQFPRTAVFHLDPSRVVAGMRLLGQWERRMTVILRYVACPGEDRPRHALYVDNPVALARIGRSAGSALTLCAVLRPCLERREFPFVIEATPEEWLRLEELERSFTDLFRVERVTPPPPERAARMIVAGVRRLQLLTPGSLSMASVRRLIELEARYPSPRVSPGGPLDRASRLLNAGEGVPVGVADVDALVVGGSGVAGWLHPKNRVDGADLRGRIEARLIGQPEAAGAMADAIQVLHAGLARPGKPLATWLLVGPTGVGKTEAAKVLTDLIYEDRTRLLRIDMNEYVDDDAADRLLGTAGRPGTLTGRVRSTPHAVVLLDEIEKAHPMVQDLLLQLLDEGRLTDGDGRLVDFERVVVVLTSNAGAAEHARATGFTRRGEATPATSGLAGGGFRAAVEAAFRPEFINRLDRIIEFQPLSLDHVRRITRLQVDRVREREGFQRRILVFAVDDAAVDLLARAGFDPAMGARALKRVVEAQLIQPLAALFAELPLETPVILHMGREGDRVVTRPRVLHYAAAAGHVELPEVTAEAIAEVEALIPDRLFHYEIGPGGVVTETGTEERVIREALTQLVLPAEVPGPDELHLLSTGQAHRLLRRPRRATDAPSVRPIQWEDLHRYSSAQAFLQSFPVQLPAEEDENRRGLARLAARARAVGLAGRAAILHFRTEAGARYAEVQFNAIAGAYQLLASSLGRSLRCEWQMQSGFVCMEPNVSTYLSLTACGHCRFLIDDLPDPSWIVPLLGIQLYSWGGPFGLMEVQAEWADGTAPLVWRDTIDRVVRVSAIGIHDDVWRLTDLRLGRTAQGDEDLYRQIDQDWWPELMAQQERSE